MIFNVLGKTIDVSDFFLSNALSGSSSRLTFSISSTDRFGSAFNVLISLLFSGPITINSVIAVLSCPASKSANVPGSVTVTVLPSNGAFDTSIAAIIV